MKKVWLLIAAMLLLGGCKQQFSVDEAKVDGKEWIIDDFSLYDLEGRLYDYPQDNSLELEYFKEEDKGFQLKRGAKLFDHAKVVLEKYDFTGFYCNGSRYPVLGSNSDEEDMIIKKYLEKYPDVNEAVKHTSELNKNNLSLYISGQFKCEDGKLTQLELNELGHPIDEESHKYETYKIYMYIKNDEILYIHLNNRVP